MTNKRESVNPTKKEAVAKLAEALKAAASVAFVDYAGMNVAQQNELKKRLKEAGGAMLVAKNTLIKLAGKEAGTADEALAEEVLEGQTAMVTASEDAVAPIRVLGKYIGEFELPKFKAGVVEGKYQDAGALEAISKLPGREELVAHALGALMAPMYGVVGALQGNMQKLIFILEQAKEKGGGEVYGRE
jgi:large subunit ribosomal protein L10